MKTLLLLTLLLVGNLFANKVLYLSYTEVPQRVIKGEVFSITVKTVSTIQTFKDIHYKFNNQVGIKFLNRIPKREIHSKFYLETFYFVATRSDSRLPDITASLKSNQQYQSTRLKGKKLNVITLNPKSDYAHVIANSLELLEYKTTSYNNKYNIIVFTAIGTNTLLKTMHFKQAYKQGIESIDSSFNNPKVTYFVVINKELEEFSFTYFNLLKNSFNKITLPIILDDDSVTTQTDLKPKDQSKEKIKMNIAAGIAIVIFFFAIWRRKIIYLIFILFPILYIANFAMPSENICIKKGSQIHLLPVYNGTIFETTKVQYNLSKEGVAKNFTKVKLQNEKIGWVKNEDICTP